MLSAAGTIAIACANVVLVVVALNMWPDRPKFKLTVETQLNRERLSDRSSEEKERMRARLKVQNCSKNVTARNCIAKMELESKNGKIPMEVSSLHWNRLYYPLDLVEFKQDRPLWVSATASIDIRPGEAELLDVAFAPIWGEDGFDEGIEEKRAQVFTSNWMISRRKGIDQLEPGSHELKITIYCDNADPKATKVGLKYTRDSDLKPMYIDCSQET